MENMIRWVSSIKDESVVMRVAAPIGKNDWISVDRAAVGLSVELPKTLEARCVVKGCGRNRKYRSVKDPTVGGCSMEHLRMVNASLA